MRMYFLALVLPGEHDKVVVQYKNHMEEKYGCKVALRSPAHITLIPPFWMDEATLPELIADTDDVAEQLRRFDLQSNGFDSFKPKTIFIAVKHSVLLNETYAKVNSFFSGQDKYKMKFDKRPFHPHITLATRDLHKKAYYEAMEYFSSKKFEKQWQVNSLDIMEHNGATWKLIHRSFFWGMISLRSRTKKNQA
jgi:2'-5' RNA ligase